MGSAGTKSSGGSAGSGGSGAGGGSGGNGATGGTATAAAGGGAGKAMSGAGGTSGESGGQAPGGSGGTGQGGRSGRGGAGMGQAGQAAGAGGTSGQGGMNAGGMAGKSGGAGGGAGSDTGGHTNPLSQDVIDAFVAAHNAARARTDLDPPPDPALPPVTWDAILADSAFNYLSQCVASDGQLVDHNPDRQADYEALGGKGYVGENIYASTGQTVNPADAVDSWMSEAKDYDYASNNISAAGHYTQVVWRDSVRIGCAIVNCPGVKFSNTILCDYAPGGNITNQKPY